MSFSFIKSSENSPMASSISMQSLLILSKARASFNPVYFLENNTKLKSGRRKICRKCRAIEQGPSAAYAKEMERLSAKESLLLSFRDAGGFQGLVTGKTTDMQRMNVNERIVNLERMNPSPRPTTSPYMEGKWNFEWFGSGSLGFLTAWFLFERVPSGLAYLSKLDVVIKDTYANVAASLKLLNSIEIKYILSSRLSVEGPLRMKQEFIEGLLESPKVNEESVPQQLRGGFDLASTTLQQQLSVPIRDAVAAGLKLPLGGSSERFFMISYLDDEILTLDADNQGYCWSC
ncbi:hypothetical protein ACS0TY_030901 [Phlomoides rotata]